MSNFTKLAMQNRDAEAMRKKRKKQDIEDALLGGGCSGGSGGSCGSDNSLDSTGSSSLDYSSYSSASGGSFVSSLAQPATDLAGEYIGEKIEEGIKEGIEKLGDKAGDKAIKETAEKALKEGGEKLLKEGVEEAAEWGVKKLGKEALEKVAGYGLAALAGPAAPFIAAAMLAYDIYDGANFVSELTTGKSLWDHAKDALNDESSSENENEEDDYIRGNTVSINAAKKKIEEDKKKEEMEKVQKAKKLAEQKLKEEERKKIQQQEEEEEEEEEDVEDSESKGTSTIKRGLMKGLTHTLGTAGGTMAVSLSMIGIYKVHYTGEFEYKGISAEYQSSDYTFQNFVEYDDNGDVVLKGLSKENKLMKTFYTKYSDKSYYAIVEDSKKYKDNINDAYLRKNLLTPDELREQYPDIEDVNNREAMFQINPDVLYVLDKYIHKDEVLYPQQFVKPVYYEENQENFGLKDLLSEKGEILAKSQEFNSDGSPMKNSNGSFKTVPGIWDYGFASILRYKEYEVPRRKITTPVKREVQQVSSGEVTSQGDVLTEVLVSGAIPGASNVTENISNRPKPAYIIDTAVTPGGTVTNEIKQEWQRNSDPSTPSTKTFRFSIKTGEKEICTTNNPSGTGGTTSKPDSDDSNIPGSKPEDFTSPLSARETTIKDGETCTVVPTYTIYEVTDYYETYIEEELPQYVGEPSSENISGSEYFKDYMASYSNYYPNGLPSRLDFTVLENEEIQSLIYDDDPNSFVSGNGQTGVKTSIVSKASEEYSNYSQVQARTPAQSADAVDITTFFQIGSAKDNKNVASAMQYLPLFETYGNRYGVDPYLLIAMAAQESQGVHNPNSSPAVGIMQIERPGSTITSLTAYNFETGVEETMQIPNKSAVASVEDNIRAGAMQLASRLKTWEYNPVVSIQSYNLGSGGLKYTLSYYLGGGTKAGADSVYSNASQIMDYVKLNDLSWITTEFPGDLSVESQSAWGKDPNNGTHEARTWYKQTGHTKFPNAGGGDPAYLEHVLRYYAGPDKPWIKKPDGSVITIDGTATTASGGSGGGTPSTLFNSYLKSNWTAIMEKWDLLFPGQSELDKKLDLVKKGDYTQLAANYQAKAKSGAKSTAITIPRTMNKVVSGMTKVDTQLALNMMFALNQGNYLFKYDNMSEAEWKAMYTQLLSSPTGQTWDDKWIGFTVEDIFGVKTIDDLGTLFPTDIGVSPSISVPYGMIKNNMSGDETKMTQYNVMNFGIDIVVPPDTNVLTVADGKVVAISKKNDVSSKYGNYVKIQHAKGTTTLTANLKAVKVKVGDELKKGDVIGTSGGECKSYKDNAIFYQIINNGTLINPTWVITRDMTGFEDPISGNNGVICGGGAQVQVSNNPVVNKAISIAREQIGKPYVWGATGPNSFDCSGFMYYIMKEAGVQGGRKVAYDYYKASQEIPREQAQPGDFVFWHDLTGKKHSPVYHIGIYAGNNEVIDCSPEHDGVGIRNLEDLQDSSSRRFTIGRYAEFTGSSAVGGTQSGCTLPGNMQSASKDFTWPVPTVSTVSSPFGYRTHPVTGERKMHTGIDIPAATGTDIVASKSGTVEFSGVQNGYGNIVIIDHGDGTKTRYAHNSKNLVKKGDVVTQGQHIAEMGSTGVSTASHLHFEIREGDEAVDPLKYIKIPGA